MYYSVYQPMRSRKSIKLKAALLLTVFALNTQVSFACSVGFDMRFNNNHHANEKKNTGHYPAALSAARYANNHPVFPDMI
jgi:hypothetical protein